MPHKSQKCSVDGCEHSKYWNPDLTFHKFPVKDKSELRLKIWVNFCKSEKIKNLFESGKMKNLYENVVCGMHFEESHFMNPLDKKKLVWNAIPTLYEKIERDPNSIVPKATQTTTITAAVREPTNRIQPNWSQSENHMISTYQGNVFTPDPNFRIRKNKDYDLLLKQLRRRNYNLQQRIKYLKRRKNVFKLNQLIEAIETFTSDLNPITSEFIKYQLKAAEKKRTDKKGLTRWSLNMMNFSSSIYHHSPAAYSLLKKFFSLPSEKTIQRHLKPKNDGNESQAIDEALKYLYKMMKSNNDQQSNDINVEPTEEEPLQEEAAEEHQQQDEIISI